MLFVASLWTPWLIDFCEKDAYSGQKECANYHVGPFVIRYILHILEISAHTVTALATVLLAIVTWRLVVLGRDQSITSRGDGRAVWVWGVVHYDDCFGEHRFTQFCQRINWLADRRNVLGRYDGRFGLSN